MNFESKLKVRMFKFVILLLIGIIAVSVAIIVKLSTGIDSYSTGYLAGTGGSLIAISILMIIKNKLALNDKEKQKQMRIEENDERNLLLTYKSGYYAMLITAVTLYISTFFFAFSNVAILFTLSTVTGLLVFIYIIIYFVLRTLK